MAHLLIEIAFVIVGIAAPVSIVHDLTRKLDRPALRDGAE